MLNYSVSHKCHTPHPFYFPPIPVPALSVRQAAYAAYPHTPPLRSGVFRYSTVRLTNLVRCDHLAAPNGSVRKMNAPSVRLAILSHLTRLHSLKTVGFRPHTTDHRKYPENSLLPQFRRCFSPRLSPGRLRCVLLGKRFQESSHIQQCRIFIQFRSRKTLRDFLPQKFACPAHKDQLHGPQVPSVFLQLADNLLHMFPLVCLD